MAVLIAPVLPVSFQCLGPNPEAAGIEGPHAFTFLLVAAGLGIALSLAYVIVGSVVHLLVRRNLRAVVTIDLILGAVTSGIALWAGVTASYS